MTNNTEAPSAKGPTLTVFALLEVVGFDESRKVEAVKEPGSNRVNYLAAVSGSTQASIDVRTSKGQIFRIPVDEGILDAICGGTKPGSVWKEQLKIQLLAIKEGFKSPNEVFDNLVSQLVPRVTPNVQG